MKNYLNCPPFYPSVENSPNTDISSSVASNDSVNQNSKTVHTVSSKTRGDVVLNAGSNKPRTFVKQVEKCVCACGNTSRQNLSTPVSSQNSFGPGPIQNCFFLKKQTCFHCGTPGHIARNCPHRAYAPYYAQSWMNVPRGRSSKRDSSRSRSSDGDWNANKAKNQVFKDQKFNFVKKPDSRDTSAKPNLVKPKLEKPKSSHGSSSSSHLKRVLADLIQEIFHGTSSSSHLKHKPKSKGSPVSKSSVEAPICKNNKIVKPNYRWIPKGLASKSPEIPVISSNVLFDKQDMVWRQVACVDANGQPSVKMDWVSKAN